METGLRSRKRKQRSTNSDPFTGIFTRSKEQIHMHRHRSGYARADSVRTRRHAHSLRCAPKSLASEELPEGRSDRRGSQVSVKDLRARRVFSPTAVTGEVVINGKVDLEGDFDDCKMNKGKVEVMSSEGAAVNGDLGVFDSVTSDLKSGSENVVDSSEVREDSVMEADELVQMTPTGTESDQKKEVGEKNDMIFGSNEIVDTKVVDPVEVKENSLMEADELVQMTPTVTEPEQKKEVGEKNGVISGSNEIVDTKASMSKIQSSVTSLRGRRKVFKSPSSFSYRRLLPYLTDLGNDDSSNFEIAKLPERAQKSSTMVLNEVSSKDQETGLATNSTKLADGNNNSNSETVANMGLPDVLQKGNEDVLFHKVEECEQTTPPDLDIYSKSKIGKRPGELVKPTDPGTARNSSNDSISAPKMVLKSCSRMKALHMPTSFSHRRLLPFLMSVSEDDSCASKAVQSLKPEKGMEQNQQPLLTDDSKTSSNTTQPSTAEEKLPSLSCQSIMMDDSKTSSISGQPSVADEKSVSPTSTLIPIDRSLDEIKSATLALSENVMDVDGPDMESSRPTSELEVGLQVEAVKSDTSIKVEQESPPKKLKWAEEPISKAISLCPAGGVETLPSISADQTIDPNTIVNESTPQSSLHVVPLFSPGIYGENFRNGILKRTPRGCRGICNCLNCASFRLHAERSFEFSRNQMHDAEEVALELINELSGLRSIFERTASDPNHLAALNENQVKELCAKALYKEEVARARLAQMNEDLNIHCRSVKLLRPNVTFANKIEEKVISKQEEVVVYDKKSM